MFTKPHGQFSATLGIVYYSNSFLTYKFYNYDFFLNTVGSFLTSLHKCESALGENAMETQVITRQVLVRYVIYPTLVLPTIHTQIGRDLLNDHNITVGMRKELKCLRCIIYFVYYLV